MSYIRRIQDGKMLVRDLAPDEQALRNAIADATDYNFSPQETAEIRHCLTAYGFKIVRE